MSGTSTRAFACRRLHALHAEGYDLLPLVQKVTNHRDELGGILLRMHLQFLKLLNRLFGGIALRYEVTQSLTFLFYDVRRRSAHKRII